jgi:DNA (cytosine-5)-methyltransferase 1
MNYLSVCSGIEAATVAWHPLGWSPFAFAEIEKNPSAILAHHYPHVPNLGDMTRFKDWPDADISLLVGGTPCQSFSVAGLRKGLADPRGNLSLTYLALVDRYRPEWFVWENVPGVLSSGEGRDFGSLLGGMVELGYGFAYRVLDAQYVRVDGFGRAVPQRRRRVFVIGNSRSWRRSAAVLFEPESLSGNNAPRRQAGERVAPTISSRPTGGGGLGTDFDCDGGLVPSVDVARTLTAQHTRPDPDFESYAITHALRGEGFDASEDGTGRGTPLVPVAFSITPSNSNEDYNARLAEKAQALTRGGNRPSARGGDVIAFSAKDYGGDAMIDLAPTMRAGGHSESHANAGVMPAIAFQPRFARNDRGGPSEIAHALTSEAGRTGKGDSAQCVAVSDTLSVGANQTTGFSTEVVATNWAVRRLTPTECERLQGFPDGYTAIPKMADGPRYKALGNSMAVNVMRWLGERIRMVEEFA